MIAVPVYMAVRFVERFLGFFNNWYVRGTRFFWVHFINLLTSFDRSLAIRVTLQHLFEPLYQDRTVVGYVLGFIFRVLRVLIGFVIYLVIVAVALVLYAVWILLPAFLIFKVIENLFL